MTTVLFTEEDKLQISLSGNLISTQAQPFWLFNSVILTIPYNRTDIWYLSWHLPRFPSLPLCWHPSGHRFTSRTASGLKQELLSSLRFLTQARGNKETISSPASPCLAQKAWKSSLRYGMELLLHLQGHRAAPCAASCGAPTPGTAEEPQETGTPLQPHFLLCLAWFLRSHPGFPELSKVCRHFLLQLINLWLLAHSKVNYFTSKNH